MFPTSSRTAKAAESTATGKLDNLHVAARATLQNEDQITKSTSRASHTAVSREIVSEVYNDAEVKLGQSDNDLPHEIGLAEKRRDFTFHGIDKLVQDLLAAQKNLEDERRKGADKDAEMTRLQEKVAHLLDEARENGQKREVRVKEFEHMSALQLAHDEKVNELQRLLAFHKTNGEQASRQFRDMQAINQNLQASLQAKEMVLEEQGSLLAGLGLRSVRFPRAKRSYGAFILLKFY